MEVGGGGGAARTQPSGDGLADFFGHERKIVQGGKGNPGKIDVIRLGGFGGGRGEVGAFDRKDEGDFRNHLSSQFISLFKQAKEITDVAGNLEFFDPFTLQGLRRSFSPFDMSTRQIVMSMPNAPADQQLPILYANPSGDDFDFLFLLHGGLLPGGGILSFAPPPVKEKGGVKSAMGAIFVGWMPCCSYATSSHPGAISEANSEIVCPLS